MYFETLYESADTATWITAGAMAAALLVQLCYYLFIFRRTVTLKTREENEPSTVPVSVVICARNEAENLEKHLPAFLKQDHPDFEVVVVNDCSTDHTDEVLMNMKMEHPNLRYTSIQPDRKFTHGKKLAVTVGIKAAKNEHLLFSDADCHPASERWISRMSAHFTDGTELVLGIGKYARRRGILNLLVRYETLFTALQYTSFAIKGKPFMGVGRNMGYVKKLFYRHKGFASHLKVLSGDDDLFVNEAATPTNTAVEIHPDGMTISIPPRKLNGWFKQKKRHLSTGKYYKPGSKIRLGGEYFSRMIFYITCIVLLSQGPWIWVGTGAWVVLSFVRLVIVKLTMRRLDERDLLLPSLLFDPLMPLILGIIRISNMIRPRKPKWN
ncbi:MAG: glycosyltransferase [Bacteroidales bacterium]|nr:glycosyltransferase [Bacteroidales bacterium]MDT8430855.1 glycosyltransferase [Bacteroidales bacterium]